MTDSFPRQQARTRRFTLGAPRSFEISPDGSAVAFLRSRGGSDPVNCLWLLDVATGTERLIADPAGLPGFGAEDDELEKARRERTRELAAGIVGFATDSAFTLAAFALAGHVYVARLQEDDPAVRELPARTPAADPRPDPAGQLVAYCCDGALRIVDIATGEDRAVADPEGAAGISYGLAEFVAAEEMGRTRGYWWAPDGTALLTARVDVNPVQRWYIADPAQPATPAREIRYPSAGTPNADVSLELTRLSGEHLPVSWDREAFPYLVTAAWGGGADARRPPLLVVQARHQREMRLLAVDPATGLTSVLRADNDPHWVDIVAGVPGWTADGRIVWAADSAGTHRLLAATPGQHAAGTAEPITPPGLQVREVLAVDGDTILFSASGEDPAQVGLWLAGPAGCPRSRWATGRTTAGGRAGPRWSAAAT